MCKTDLGFEVCWYTQSTINNTLSCSGTETNERGWKHQLA